MVGRPRKVYPAGQGYSVTSVRIRTFLIEQAAKKGINVSKELDQYLAERIGKFDDIMLADLDREIEDLEAQISMKRGIREMIAKRQQDRVYLEVQNRLEEMVDPYALKELLQKGRIKVILRWADMQHTTKIPTVSFPVFSPKAYDISAFRKKELEQDIIAGNITPNSDVWDFSRYGLKVVNEDIRNRIRTTLREELGIKPDEISEEELEEIRNKMGGQEQ